MRKVISRFGVTRALCILGIFLVPVLTAIAHVPEFNWPTDEEGNEFNRTEAIGCADCHFNAGMEPVVETFVDSAHANSSAGSNQNTYCAGCHSPFQADPLPTHSENDPVASADWEAITCAACHPPHDLRVEWETDIGTYDVATGEWSPVYDSNDLCEHCHEGTRHAKDFQGFGQSMFTKKLVKCVDCHMPKVPLVIGTDPETEEPVTVDKHTHAFRSLADAPELHGPSCGIGDDNCHANKTVEWATKQIDKMIIHANKVKKEKSNEGNHGGNGQD